MKKQTIYTLLLLTGLWACNPMEDINTELDNAEKPYQRDIEYTLTNADYKLIRDALIKKAENKDDSAYANAIDTYKAFNERYTYIDYVHLPLATNFPGLKDNSTSRTTFNTKVKTADLVALETSSNYKLTDSDYAAAGGKVAELGFFYPSAPASAKMPSILSSALPDADSGQHVVAAYQYSASDPGTGSAPIVHFNYDFDEYADKDSIGSPDGWHQYIETGNRGWLARVYNENGYAQYSSYGSKEENVTYLISPPIDASGTELHELTFDINVGYWTHDGLQVLISDEYDGTNFEGASWEDITSNFSIPQAPTSGYGTFLKAGSADISKYSSNICIAFKYTGDANNAKTTTYQIDNVKVAEITESLVTSEPYEMLEMYWFNGTTWLVRDDVYTLNKTDYNAMGITEFSSTKSPNYYLPIHLGMKYPYAYTDQSEYMVYQYYDVDKLIYRKAGKYVFSNGEWTTNSTGSILTKTEQFAFSSDLQLWKPDPSVKITIAKADYQLIVDYVVATFGEQWLGKSTDGTVTYTNTEVYYGTSAYYGNFDKSKWATDHFKTWEDCAIEAVGLGYLPSKFPDAQTQVNGIDVHYFVTIDTYYNGSRPKYTLEFQCTKSGPSPEFTFINMVAL